MIKKITTVIIIYLMVNISQVQAFNWTVKADGIYRDGVSFFMNGQSWAKHTPLTYNKGSSEELIIKKKLSELNAIGVNTLRIYGSPDDNDWAGSANFENLIRWIEEWNLTNPDGGNPNNAIYYIVQINPKDNQSTISDLLPRNNSASFNRAIHDTSNPASVATLTGQVDDITDGSQYLLGYMIYHELNGSNKYTEWYEQVGASGIETFMNAAADALHNTYALGKLVTHTGDAKQPTVDIYEQIENIDSADGNVFDHFDLLGFNLYISTKEMLNEGSYYKRILQRRGFSVNSHRGWYIGETGASSDVAATTTIPAVNYTNEQGVANLQLMWKKTKDLGSMIGFMLFTVQDNDLGSVINDNMKQRGYFDVYGDQKYLYHAYADVINEVSSNERFHFSDTHSLGLSIIDGITEYTVIFDFKNKTSSDLIFSWAIHGDDGSSNQRFTRLFDKADIIVAAGQSSQIVNTLVKSSSYDLFLVSAALIDDINPSNAYLWGREHLYGDAISTIAGLNYKTNNSPAQDDSPQKNERASNSK